MTQTMLVPVPTLMLLVFSAALIHCVRLNWQQLAKPNYYFYCNVASLVRFQATVDHSNQGTLSWQQPNITKRHGIIQHYLINCSTENLREDNN